MKKNKTGPIEDYEPMPIEVDRMIACWNKGLKILPKIVYQKNKFVGGVKMFTTDVKYQLYIEYKGHLKNIGPVFSNNLLGYYTRKSYNKCFSELLKLTDESLKKTRH